MTPDEFARIIDKRFDRLEEIFTLHLYEAKKRDRRIAALERLAKDPTPILEKWGIPSLTQEQLDTFIESLTETLAHKIVQRRISERARRWDNRWLRWSAVATVGAFILSTWAALLFLAAHR